VKPLAKNFVNKRDTKQLALNEARGLISKLETDYEPHEVIEKAALALSGTKSKLKEIEARTCVFNAMTLSEFENGTLLTTIVPEAFRAFGLNMLRQLQKDYECTLIGEKATAELVTTTYIRTLVIQKRLDFYLERTELNKADLAFIAILSKEQDRSTRQYLAALQTLRMMKIPPLQLNLRTDTAIFGQNQIIQENRND
jgi:hypothetical protein